MAGRDSNPKADNRPAVNVLQWIQYQLDCNETVDQVIASDKLLRISSTGTPLHYLVADAKGSAATIEFLDGKMVVYKGSKLPFPVLTNNSYEESIRETKNPPAGRSFTDNSLDRFATACTMVQLFRQQDIRTSVTDYAFGILEKVSQGNFTKWSIVYDITARKVYFKSADYPASKSIAFSSFDFSCPAISKMLDINQSRSGEVSAYFRNFSITEARTVLETAIRESRSRVTITNSRKEAILDYTKETTCR